MLYIAIGIKMLFSCVVLPWLLVAAGPRPAARLPNFC